MVQIGQALGQYTLERSRHPVVVVGRDTRPSGRELLPCLVAGLLSQGVDVINLEIITTPGVAFLARRQHADLGIVITASHNPLDYNGIKLVGPNGLRLQREEELEIEDLIEEFSARAHDHARVPGKQTDGRNLKDIYIADHVQRCPTHSLRRLRVILDCADGAVSPIAPEVFRRLDANYCVVNSALDTKNIMYHCGSEHVRQDPRDLLRIMEEMEADYGFAFDGDGDRLVVVDRDARVYDGNDLLYALARHVYAEPQWEGDAVVTIYHANRGLEEALAELSVRTEYTRNGDKFLEAAMWAGGYMLGGEPGGNIIINDGHHTAADAIYAAVLLGGILAQNPDTTLYEIALPFKRRPQVTTSLELEGNLTLSQRRDLEARIREWEHALGGEGRILFWPSSTQPGVFRLLVEGGRESRLQSVLAVHEKICQFVENAVVVRDWEREICPPDRRRVGTPPAPD
jgi:phosphoglucosamine mutase